MTNPKPSIDFGYPLEPHGDVPGFQNIEEEAEFWDTHHFTDYVDGQWTVHPGRPLEVEERMVVSLVAEDHEALVEQARERNLQPSDLAAIWIEDRLRHELEKKAS